MNSLTKILLNLDKGEYLQNKKYGGYGREERGRKRRGSGAGGRVRVWRRGWSAGDMWKRGWEGVEELECYKEGI